MNCQPLSYLLTTLLGRMGGQASCHLLATDTETQIESTTAVKVFIMRWDKCLCVSDIYLEVWCVPSATHEYIRFRIKFSLSL